MNKQDLIEAVLANKEAGIESKAAAARAIDAVLDGIAAGIKKDGNVQLIRFRYFLCEVPRCTYWPQSADWCNHQDQGFQDCRLQGWCSSQGNCC